MRLRHPPATALPPHRVSGLGVHPLARATARLSCGMALVAIAAGAAQAFVDVGKLGTCTTVAVCTGTADDTCTPASASQRLFSARVPTGDATSALQLWVETAYSRFPKSDVNETTGFLPANILTDEAANDRITALADGRETISGAAGALWGRFDRAAQPVTLHLYQFNPRGLIRRWNVHCKPGDI